MNKTESYDGMSYIVLAREHVRWQDALDYLRPEVDRYMRQGWQTSGGVSLAHNGTIWVAAQALIWTQPGVPH